MINFSKTNVVFSQKVPYAHRLQITLSLDIQEVLSHDKYLGAPMFVGRSRKKHFLFLVDHIKKRLLSFMDRLTSWAGREELIKAVAQAIPTYIMSTFQLSKELCQSIQSAIVSFWWGHHPADHKIH